MKWRFLNFCFSVIILCCACSRQHEESQTLKEKEYTMDEPLTALSVDGDSAFWLGSENGMVWHFKGMEKHVYELETDRIYDIVPESAGNNIRTCWFGVRNAGLQLWQLRSGHMTFQKSYTIPGKGNNYSVYDIEIVSKTLYAATSQGLYRLALPDREAQLQRIFPLDTLSPGSRFQPFVVRKICRLGKFIFACTPVGLLRIDTETGKTTILHRGRKVSYTACFNNMLYVLIERTLYIEDANGCVDRRMQLSMSPLSVHQTGDVLYFMSLNHVTLTQDGDKFVTIPLRHNIPANCPNIVAYDAKKGFTMLLTENALWKIPSHSGIFNAQAPVMASCTDGQNAYYITANNGLYKQKLGEKKAHLIYQFSKEEVIVDIKTSKDNLYYFTDDHEVKQIKVSDHPIRNELLASPRVLYHSGNKITAFHLYATPNGNKLLVGIQDGLVSITDDHSDTIKGMIGQQYVTSFFQPQHSDIIYMSTLNGGVFYGDGSNIRHIEPTSRQPFLNDLIVTGGYQQNLIMLTPHHLFLNQSTDTFKVKGMKKLLYVNDSVFYGLPRFGLIRYGIENRKIRETGRYYEDISFNPHAAFASDTCLYLGSQLGVMEIPVGNELSSRWVYFYETSISLQTIIYTLGILFIIIFLAYIGYVRYRQSTRRQAIHRINDLQNRLAELQSTVWLIKDADNEDVEKLRETLALIKPDMGDRREMNKCLQQVSDEIMRKNRNVVLLLLKELDRQIEEIKVSGYYESERYLKASQEALNTGITDIIKKQVQDNAEWLRKGNHISSLLTQYAQKLHDAIPLECVTKGFMDQIEQSRECLITRPISEVEKKIHALEQQYDHIFSTDAMFSINRYIEIEHEWLSDEKRSDKVSSALKNQLESIADTAEQTDRLQLLIMLNRFELRINQMRTLERLNDAITDYTVIHNRIVYENELRMNKKFDIQLQTEIARHTETTTKEIDSLIEQLFADMGKSDPEILNDLFRFTNVISQQGKVLALLMANPKVKRTLLPGLLGIYGNLNPVVSRLVSGKIKNGKIWLDDYIKKHPSSMATLILRIAE